MRLTRYSFVILAVVLAVSAFPAAALGQTNSSDADVAAVATITQMENSSIRADLAGDSSFVEKNYAENFTGGSSWGNWETKQSILADMKDRKNKTNSDAISELSVRVYGDTAIATYKSTYDSLYQRRPTRSNDSVDRHVCPAERFVEASGQPQFRTREIGFTGTCLFCALPPASVPEVFIGRTTVKLSRAGCLADVPERNWELSQSSILPG